MSLKTDKIRRSALVGVLLYPLAFLATWLALRAESDACQRTRNMEILRQMHSLPIFFGRTQIALTRKLPHDYRRP